MSPRRLPTIKHYALGRIDPLTDPTANYMILRRSDIHLVDVGEDDVEIAGSGRKFGDLGEHYTWRMRFNTTDPHPALNFEYTGPDVVGDSGRAYLLKRLGAVLGGLGSPSARGAGDLRLEDPVLEGDGWAPQVTLRRGPILLAVWDTDFGVLVPPCVTLPFPALDLLSEYAGTVHRNKRDADELLSTLNDLLTH